MSNVYGGDEVNALVFDVGSHTTKAGYAGDDAPKAVFPSSMGVIQGGTSMDTDGAKPARQLFVGQSGVNFRRDNMEVASPFSATDDTIADWDMLEALWSHAYKDRLRADPTESALLLAETNTLSKAAREKCVELLFERFKVPAVFLAKNAALSAFAMARQSALVVDAGHRFTTVTAVHDGYVLSKTGAASPIGGKVLTVLMQRALEAKAVNLQPRYSIKRVEVSPGEFKVEHLSHANTPKSFHSFQVEQLVADIKESLCRVHELPFDERIHAQLAMSTYELPDGTEIAVGPDRVRVPEVMFQPHLLSGFPGFNQESIRRPDGNPLQSLPELVLESVNKCDVDVRREMYQNIVLTGGVSQTSGLRDRLEKDLMGEGPAAGRFKVNTPANLMERKFSVWIGGSILASLGSFQQMWMSRKEYEEHGADLINRKSP